MILDKIDELLALLPDTTPTSLYIGGYNSDGWHWWRILEEKPECCGTGWARTASLDELTNLPDLKHIQLRVEYSTALTTATLRSYTWNRLRNGYFCTVAL